MTYVWKRKHNFTFGYMVRVADSPNNNEQSARGQFSFDGAATAQYSYTCTSGTPGTLSCVNPVATAVRNTGYGLADFLLGMPYTSSKQLATNDYLRNWATAGFVQDDYRVARGVTINVGLRYEYFAPDTEKYGRLTNMVLNSSQTEAALVTPAGAILPGSVTPLPGQNVSSFTQQSLPSSLVEPERMMFSPRIGVAWRPSQKHSTNFRAGYSIFHSGGAYGTIANNMLGQPPFTENAINTACPIQVQNFQNGVCPAGTVLNPISPVPNPISMVSGLSAVSGLTLENGFPSAGKNTLTNTWAINPNQKLPYAQNWTFTVAQTLPHNVLLELEYIGTKGTDLTINEAPAIGQHQSVQLQYLGRQFDL